MRLVRLAGVSSLLLLAPISHCWAVDETAVKECMTVPAAGALAACAKVVDAGGDDEISKGVRIIAHTILGLSYFQGGHHSEAIVEMNAAIFLLPTLHARDDRPREFTDPLEQAIYLTRGFATMLLAGSNFDSDVANDEDLNYVDDLKRGLSFGGLHESFSDCFIDGESESATIAACTALIVAFDGKKSDFPEWQQQLPKPAIGVAYFSRGSALYSSAHSRSEKERAIEDISTAISINPKYFVPYLFTTSYFIDREDFDAALRAANALISLAPDYIGAYNLRGIALSGLENDEWAVDAYTKAISLEPDYFTAYVNRAISLYRQGKDELAMQDFNRARALEPDNPILYYKRGKYYEYRKNFSAAIGDFTKMLELDSDEGSAYNARGYAYLRSGDPSSAIADFERATEANRASAEFHHSLGEGYYYAGERGMARTIWIKACELADQDRILDWQEDLAKLGHYSDALDGVCGSGTLAAFASCSDHGCSF